MKRLLLIIAVILGILLVAVCTRTAALPPDEPRPSNPAIEPKPGDTNRLKLPTRKETMARKLKSSQTIHEGIALNDYDKSTPRRWNS